MVEFPKRLKALMDERDITAAEMVRLSLQYDKKGFSKANVSQWLSGVYVPNTANIHLLSRIFNVNPNYFMENCGVSDTERPLSENDGKMMNLMHLLNEEGQNVALERITELTMISKYKK